MPSSVSANLNVFPASAQYFFPAPDTPHFFPDANSGNRCLTSHGSLCTTRFETHYVLSSRLEELNVLPKKDLVFVHFAIII
jgi:hypothetical protein